MTLHEALAAQGVVSHDCTTVGKRRLVLMPTCRELGEWSAKEAWQGLRSGLLIYRQ